MNLRIDIFPRLLVALLLVALLPLIVFWQLVRANTLERGAAEAQQQLQIFADRVIQQVDDWARLNLKQMQLAASQPNMRSMRTDDQRSGIALLMPQLPWAYLIHTVDLAGDNVARSDDKPLASYRDRSYYTEILKGRPYSADVQIGHTSHRPAFLIAVPITSTAGALSGMLIQASTLDHVTEAVTSARLGKTGFAFLLTPKGSLFAHANEPLRRELKDYSKHPAFLAAQHGDGFYHYSTGGIERAAQIRRTELGWIAVVQQDVSENLEPMREANRHALLLLGVTVGLVTLFSGIVARGFARPIEQATRAATAISRGQLDVSIEIGRGDEIGDLMRAMQAMQQTLQGFMATQRRLTEAATRGDFSERGDERAFDHSYADMVGLLNRLMSTADRGFTEFAVVLAAIAEGDLTVSLHGEYEGTFADLQNATNATVRALARMIEQIELHRNLLNATLEHLPQGISVVDLELKVITWNRRYEEIFDYPQDLLARGRPIQMLMEHNAALGRMGPAGSAAEIQRRLGHLRRGAPYESERSLPGGAVLEIRGNAVPGVGYVTSFSDITAYKRTEQALRALTQSLERRVAERTADLQSAKADAERANRSKTRFVAAAVHDLMQPLDAAHLFIGALKPRLRTDTDLEMLDSIDRALRAADEILSGLWDISRLESGSIDVMEREFPVSTLLETLGREFGILMQARGIELRVSPCRGWIRSDEALLRRILQNFLTNALRYTLRGTVLLGCRCMPKSLRVEVWDTGPGIAEADQQRVFFEFQRLDNANRETELGAGLGLAIVEQIGKRLNHPIGLRSWPGRGSVFSVTVPLVVGAPRPSAASVAGDPLLAKRIWCLDDDPRVLGATQALLREWGCLVTALAGGNEALKSASVEDAPELLLLDYQLADGIGPDFVPELRRRWGSPVPVIVVSGDHEPIAGKTALENAWGFLRKPIRPAELRALMTQTLVRAGSWDR